MTIMNMTIFIFMIISIIMALIIRDDSRYDDDFANDENVVMIREEILMIARTISNK